MKTPPTIFWIISAAIIITCIIAGFFVGKYMNNDYKITIPSSVGIGIVASIAVYFIFYTNYEKKDAANVAESGLGTNAAEYLRQMTRS